MNLALDIPTLVSATILLRMGQSVALAMLWFAQRDYQPAKDWAIGAFMCSLGLILILFSEDRLLLAVLSNALLLCGWLIFDIGIIRAAGFEPPVRSAYFLAGAVLVIMVWLHTTNPFPGGRAFAFHIAVCTFDLAAAWSCFRAKTRAKNSVFRVLGVFLTLLAVSGAVRGITLLSEAPDEAFASTNFFGNVQYGLVGLMVFLVVTVQLALITIDRLSRELERQARRDPLTDALNRRGFVELADRELARAARRNQQVSIISLDIDHFKNFNDKHGHDAGDLMLKAVSDCARKTLRPEDLWARFGGEEFVALLVDASPAVARQIAERLRLSVAELSAASRKGAVLKVTASIGVASLDIGARSWSTALHDADRLLYEAKSSGRNTVRSEAIFDGQTAYG